MLIRQLKRVALHAAAGVSLIGFLSPVAVEANAQIDSARPLPKTSDVVLRLWIAQQDDLPVVGAEISVKDSKTERTIRSDSSGKARLEGLRPGNIEIRVRRVGFKPSEMLTRVAGGNNDFTVYVDAATTELDEIRVVASKPVISRHEEFDLRVKRREASAYVTAEQIDKRNPVRLSQMLRSVPGVRISEGLTGTIAIATRGKNPTRGSLYDCVMRVMIDGVIQPQDSNIDQIVPSAAYGIEVFSGPAAIPLKYQGARSDQWCGLIAIWTRSG